MVRGLGIETSSQVGSVALSSDGQVLAEQSFEHGLQNAARIVSSIDELCKQLAWAPADIREIYVSIGPGSFTGLRIGVTLAKTLAFATGAKIVTVPSVDVLAQNAPEPAQNLIVLIDAKRDQIFTASFQKRDSQWMQTQPARLSTLAEALSTSPRPVYLLGQGIVHHAKFIGPSDTQVISTPSELWRPRAAVVACLGWSQAQAGKFANAMGLAPLYIRRPEAEEKWLEAALLKGTLTPEGC